MSAASPRAARRSLIGGLVALFGRGTGSAQPATPEQVPAAWVTFAGVLGKRMEAALARTDAASAVRLHRFLDDRAAAATATAAAAAPADQAAQAVVRVWVDDAGQVSRVEFASLGDAQADADLRGLLLGASAGLPSPPGMRQPITIRIRLAIPA